MKNDNVKHPSHYVEGRKFEPKDVIRDWGLNFNLGNAVKYLARAGRKAEIVTDLKKAQEYIQFEIDALTAGVAEQGKDPQADNDYVITPIIDFANDTIKGVVVKVNTRGIDETVESILEAFLSDLENSMKDGK